jgi:hypothetical protein
MDDIATACTPQSNHTTRKRAHGSQDMRKLEIKGRKI